MKNQTKTTVFIVSVIVLLIGCLVALNFLTNKQQEPSEGFFTYQKSDYKVDGFDLENQPMIGDKDAPVTLIIFSDFSCSHCKTFEMEHLKDVEKQLIETGKAKLYFLNYAFMNDSSYRGAVAVESVWKQNPDAFLSYYKAIFTLQNNSINTWANKTSLTKLADDLQLDVDVDKLKKDIESYAYLSDVYQDKAIAEAHNVQSTPTMLIHNVQVDPKDADSVQDISVNPMDVEELTKTVDALIETTTDSKAGDTNE